MAAQAWRNGLGEEWGMANGQGVSFEADEINVLK